MKVSDNNNSPQKGESLEDSSEKTLPRIKISSSNRDNETAGKVTCHGNADVLSRNK